MKNKYPKILFLTVNGWNNTTGTSTISSLIEGYPPECVANIFIRADRPNSPVCKNYFRIDEIKVFKSVIKRKIKTGSVIEVNENDTWKEDRNIQNNLKKLINTRTPFIRDFFWKAGKWNTPELKKFISDFDPDIIMFPVEGLIHFNNIGRYISSFAKKRTGMFFWDDNFTYKPVTNIISKLYRFFLRKNIKKVVKNADFAFSFSPKMQKECEDILGLKTKLITKPMVNVNEVSEYKQNDGILKILYTGSLHIDRNKTVEKLIESLKKINTEKKCFFLDIYTNTILSDDEKNNLNVEGVSCVHPPITKEEVLKLQTEADILLFTEALTGKYKYAARLSFSTKIVDYLSSKRCILAIAPRDISPTEYLNNNNLALIAENENEIENVLHSILENRKILSEYGNRAYDFCVKNHSKEIVYKTLVEEIMRN